MRFSIDSADIRKIDLREIDAEDDTFRITSDIAASALTDDLDASVRSMGILAPPVLLEHPGGFFSIICGFRRIRVCRRLGRQTIDARIISASSSDPELILLSIADNIRTRQLNVVEQATAAAKLSGCFKDPRTLCREAQKAGWVLNPGLLSKLLKVNTLCDEIREKLARDAIPLTIGLELGTLEKPDTLKFLQIIEKLKPTLNHQKEIIRLAKEIARLKDCMIQDILITDAVAGIIDDTDLDRNRKIQKVRRALRRMRYPEIVRFEEQFSDYVRQLNLPDFLHLTPPADFEGTVFSIHGSFSCPEEFETMVQALDRLREHPGFLRILKKKFEDH